MYRRIVIKYLRGGIKMEVKVCTRCKKMFQYITGPNVCPKCRQIEEEQFQKVKEYLRENPGAAMNVVSEETSVPVKLIQSFLKQGRLEVVPGSPMMIHCEKCGLPIVTGKYCNKCKAELVGELSAVASEITKAKDANAEQHNEKMRFLKSERIK